MSPARPLTGVLPSAALGRPAHRSEVALGILAGGRAQRLGGIDKALARYEDTALVERTLAALGAGYAQAMISYNGDAHAQLPAELQRVSDLRPGFCGPLAGVEALLAACHADWLLTVPVDLLRIPGDLFESLRAHALDNGGVRARDADGEQPLVAIWPVSRSLDVVSAALEAGEFAVHRVQALLDFGNCDFSPWRFGNLNTPADFAHGR
jgi:molybdopterin-guanine dinucleotide biosynthesis protein A